MQRGTATAIPSQLAIDLPRRNTDKPVPTNSPSLKKKKDPDTSKHTPPSLSISQSCKKHHWQHTLSERNAVIGPCWQDRPAIGFLLLFPACVRVACFGLQVSRETHYRT